jgi:hypothetical protein
MKIDAQEMKSSYSNYTPRAIFGVFTDYWFWTWLFLLISGFAYVNAILCHRVASFQPDGGYDQIFKIILLAPLLYIFGPRFNIKPENRNPNAILLHFGAGYILPFFIALHWYYLQNIPNINYSITPSDLMQMNTTARLVFGAAALLIIFLAAYHAILAQKQGYLKLYISTLFGFIGLIVLISFLVRHTHTFHIHHYFLFGMFIPWARFRNPISLISQALCAGVYIEGVAEWGMATLWPPIH